MSTQTLSGVTLETLENYRTAATRAVLAYRVGSQRLVGVVNDVLADSVYPRTARVAPRATDRMNEVRDSVTTIVVKGIDQVANGTDKAIELGTTTAAAQVTKVAEFAAGIDNEFVANGLQVAARLTMPGAKVALMVSSKVAEGANALADGVGAKPVRKAIRKAATIAQRKAAPVARRARVTASAAGKRAAKVAKTVQVPLAKARRGARSAARAA